MVSFQVAICYFGVFGCNRTVQNWLFSGLTGASWASPPEPARGFIFQTLPGVSEGPWIRAALEMYLLTFFPIHLKRYPKISGYHPEKGASLTIFFTDCRSYIYKARKVGVQGCSRAQQI